jgi:N-acetylmuramoyl-L-alanine amidase
MRVINRIVIHCSASPNGKDFTAKDIDTWHKERGFRRSGKFKFNTDLTSIGYHFVIKVDGEVETGRDEAEVGAHAYGYNMDSVGICVIGTDKFSDAQWKSLAHLVRDLEVKYPQADVMGHRDLPGVKKSCPGFKVADWWPRSNP